MGSALPTYIEWPAPRDFCDFNKNCQTQLTLDLTLASFKSLEPGVGMDIGPFRDQDTS